MSKKEVERLRREYEAMKEEMETMKAKVGALTAENEAMKAENVSVMVENEALKEEMEAMKAENRSRIVHDSAFPWVDLPWGVLVCLLREWLDMEDTAKLDTAMSCIEDRAKLLEVLGSGEVCYQGSRVVSKKIYGAIKAPQVEWVGLRGVSLLGLAARSDVTAEMLLSVTRNSPGLENLRLNGVVGLSVAQMSEIGQSCPNVKELCLYNMQNTDTDAIVTEAANHMHALEDIQFDKCEGVGDVALVALSQHCPRLKRFFIRRMQGGSDVTHEGIVRLAQGCRLLEEIMLYFVRSFTGDSMRAIADNCTSLKELTILLNNYQPLPLTDDDLVYFSQRCTMTTDLQIFTSHLITDAAVTKMVQYLSQLTVMSFNRFTLLTDDAVRAIAKYLPNLSLFGFLINDNITDASIIKIAESCTKLTNLYLCNCRQISDATMDKLGEHCPLLETLDCQGCPLITEVAATRLKQRLPKLTISK